MSSLNDKIKQKVVSHIKKIKEEEMENGENGEKFVDKQDVLNQKLMSDKHNQLLQTINDQKSKNKTETETKID